MATVTICDVKVCGDIIKGDVFNTTIAKHMYQLCKKCYDGLIKFSDEHLNKLDSKESPISKLVDPTKTLQDYIGQMSKFTVAPQQTSPYQTFPGIIYTTSPFSISTPNDIKWDFPAITTGTSTNDFEK